MQNGRRTAHTRMTARRMAPWLLLFTLPACIDRTRLNATCEWTHDSARTLDLAAPADRRHLVADAQLAEGLAVRYADTEHRRRSGYGGHGGLIDHGRLLHECFGTLARRIEQDHGVAAVQIDEARRVRDPRFDLSVALVFVALYAFVSMRVARWIPAASSTPVEWLGCSSPQRHR